MGKFFGTDGIRGIANTQLSCEFAFRIGKAAALVLTQEYSHKPTILIGKDTRISSDMLEAALVAGFCSYGANVHLLGVIPTPAVAYFVRKLGADAGVVISASHNSMEYNGIKIFNSDGYKLSDELEGKIEEILDNEGFEFPVVSGGDIGRVDRYETAKEEYVKFIADLSCGALGSLKMVIDCANGSASETAPMLFSALGANAKFIHNTPNGTNINDGCGSTHLESLMAEVTSGGYDVGVAFDGDADRVLIVDEKGREVDGDKIIAGLALDMKKNGTLKNDTAVVTIMSNMGFFKLMEKENINTAITKVGDRYVLEEMLKNGYNIGGEQSGHIILLDCNTTGDGELSAVKWLGVLAKMGCKASQLADVMEKFPQTMINVKVTAEGKKSYEANEKIKAAIDSANKEMAGMGRVVVRASGTEDLVRVMLEGKDLAQIERLAKDIADTIKSIYGV